MQLRRDLPFQNRDVKMCDGGDCGDGGGGGDENSVRRAGCAVRLSNRAVNHAGVVAAS